MRERVEAMREIWTQDEADYHGKHVDFEPIWSWPKPVQQPHPPVLVGGNGARVLDRVLAYGDGWIPNREPRLAERISELQARAAQAGRGHLPVTYFGVPADPAAVARMEAGGVDRAVFMLPSASAEVVEPRVDELAALVERHRDGLRSGPGRRARALRRRPLGAAGVDAGRPGPHLVPICFAVAGETIYSAVDLKPKRTSRLQRLENLAADPRAALLADHYSDEDWSALWWVRASGRARILEPGDAEAVTAVDRLVERYAQYREARPAGAVLAVDVERWVGWAAS